MIVGGQGTLVGPPVGAIVISIVNEFFRFAGSYRLVMYTIIVILMMWLRPQGLLGVNPNMLSSTKKKQANNKGGTTK